MIQNTPLPVTTTSEIGRRRLLNQRIAEAKSDRPGDSLGWMGLIQAQDYLGALWAIGLRTQNATELNIEKALADRSILRTWLARGTLHFVAPEDIHWMLNLLAPHELSHRAGRHRRLSLDEVDFDRSRKLFTDLLKGNNRLSRKDMMQALEMAHISSAGQRGIHIIGRMALEGLICFGPREGKQQTFVLLDEWVPQPKEMTREQSLAELSRRYFTSHGPATVQDFTWWSGLTTSEVKASLEMCEAYLEQEMINGRTYWQSKEKPGPQKHAPEAFLLPPFDEYLVGYSHRADVLDPQHAKRLNSGGGILYPAIVIDGQVLGTWKRSLGKEKVTIEPDWFDLPTQAQRDAFRQAALQYGAFLNLPVSQVDE